MKRALNIKSGAFRLTLVISILISTFMGRKAASLSDKSYFGWYHFFTTFFDGGVTFYTSDFQLGNFLAVFIATSTIIWIIYLVIFWIIIGFTNE